MMCVCWLPAMQICTSWSHGEGFREDLLWRLAVVEVDIPSLFARMEDLPCWHTTCARMHRLARRVDGLDASAMDVLLSYTWPGNVRELEHAIARAVAVTRGPLISAVDLPPSSAPQDPPAVQLAGACNRMNVNASKPLWRPISRTRTQAALAGDSPCFAVQKDEAVGDQLIPFRSMAASDALTTS